MAGQGVMCDAGGYAMGPAKAVGLRVWFVAVGKLLQVRQGCSMSVVCGRGRAGGGAWLDQRPQGGGIA